MSFWHRQKSSAPKTGPVCPRPGSREKADHPPQPSQHHPQVPYQQPRIATAIPGPHHSPSGPALIQETRAACQTAKRRHQPERPQLFGLYTTTGKSEIVDWNHFVELMQPLSSIDSRCHVIIKHKF